MFRFNKLTHKLLLVFILLLAFGLRVWAIDQVPPGLSHDEAYNGVTAIQVLAGQRRIFFEINKGIEPLIIYLEALAFYAFGIGPVQLRLVNIFCGLLTVVLVYPLTTRLFNRRVALLAMLGVAISFWAIFVSRLTLRAVTLPPLLILTVYCFWRGLTSMSNKQTNPQSAFRIPHSLIPIPHSPFLNFVLSGILAGASMYTYLSSRFIPFLILAIFGYQFIRGQIKKRHWVGLIVHFVIWAAIFAPLAGYYIENAASFTERYNQVATLPYALNGDFGPLSRNTLRTLGMFTFYGDKTDRYNLDGRPVFDWVNGVLFYVGLVIVLLRLRRAPGQAGPAAFLLLWLLFMLIPDFITDDSPHFLRTLGALPATYILWALGVEAASLRFDRWLTGKRPASEKSNSLPASRFPLALLVLLTTIHTGYDYFERWASAAEARYIYGADIAEIAGYLKAHHDEGLVAISAEYYRDLDPFRLALHFAGQPPFVIWFDGRQTLAFPPQESNLSPAYIFSTSAPPADNWLPFIRPAPAESGRDYTLYHLSDEVTSPQSSAAPLALDNSLGGININNDLVLAGYQVLGSVVSGGKFQVLLGWQALRRLPPGTDYTLLVRLRDSQGHLWAEDDGLGYTPADWQPGVQALQLLTLRLPLDLPPRAYQLTVEVVDRHQGRALPSAGGDTVIPLTILPGHLADKPRIIDPARLPNPTLPDPNAETDGSSVTEVALRGYRIHNPVVRPGDRLSLTLHWQVLNQPQQDYQLLFFLTDVQGASPPVPIYHWPGLLPIGGEWPTHNWPAAYWVQDKVDLPVNTDIPAGQFKLWGAWIPAGVEPSDWLDRHARLGPYFELAAIIIETQ